MINDILKELSEENLKKRVLLPNGIQITLKQYIQEFIPSVMGQDGLININGNKIDIRSHINSLIGKKEEKVNNNNNSNNTLIGEKGYFDITKGRLTSEYLDIEFLKKIKSDKLQRALHEMQWKLALLDVKLSKLNEEQINQEMQIITEIFMTTVLLDEPNLFKILNDWTKYISSIGKMGKMLETKVDIFLMDETFFNNFRKNEKGKQINQLNQQKNVDESLKKQNANDDKYESIADDLLRVKRSIDKRYRNIFDGVTIDTDALYKMRHQYENIKDQLRRLRLQLGEEKFIQLFHQKFIELYKSCNEKLDRINLTIRSAENFETGFRR